MKSKLKHSGSRKPQLARPTTCVIAQQYSSVTFVSLLFQSRKEKSRSFFENVTISVFAALFKNFLSLNLIDYFKIAFVEGGDRGSAVL